MNLTQADTLTVTTAVTDAQVVLCNKIITLSECPLAKECLPVQMQAYDCVLGAAIFPEGQGRSKLHIQSDWAWLLTEFAVTYGVRSTYAALAYLAWVVRYVVYLSGRMEYIYLLPAECDMKCIFLGFFCPFFVIFPTCDSVFLCFCPLFVCCCCHLILPCTLLSNLWLDEF